MKNDWNKIGIVLLIAQLILVGQPTFAMEKLEISTKMIGGSLYVYQDESKSKRLIPIEIEEIEQETLRLVNKDNPIPEGYKPTLLSVDDKEKLTDGSLNQLNPVARHNLLRMFAAGVHDGKKGWIVDSAYRTVELQTVLFNRRLSKNLKIYKTREAAENKTAERVARPGTSEHHTGLAVDILSNGYSPDAFYKSKNFTWLKANSKYFGFILRYPEGKTPVTHVMFEPWHYRYLGVPYSIFVTDSGLAYESFIDDLRKKKQAQYAYKGVRYELRIFKGVTKLACEAGLNTSVYRLTKDEVLLVIKTVITK